jgi:hypothetical protein
VRIFKGDGHDLLRGGEGLLLHGSTAEVHGLGIDGAPLAGLFVEDEQPLVRVRQGVEGVGAGGDGEDSDPEVGGGDEGGGIVGARAPWLAIGDQLAHDLAGAHGGGSVVDGDGLTAEGDVGLRGRTWERRIGGGWGVSHLSEAGGGEDQSTSDGANEHGFPHFLWFYHGRYGGEAGGRSRQPMGGVPTAQLDKGTS